MSTHDPLHSPDRLAEGENLSTTSRQEAERWVAMYAELTHFETELIDSVKAKLTRMSPEARRETQQTNLPGLEEDAARFRARLAFWRDRLTQLKDAK